MNRNLLVVMLVLLGAAVALVLWLKPDDAARTAAPPNPLRSIDWAGVRRLAVVRREGEAWSLAREDGAWMLRSEVIAEGRPVAADDEITARMIGFLRDARELDARDAADLDLAGLDLDPPAAVLTVEDPGGAHRIAIGRADAEQEVAFRAPDAAKVYRVPARVFGDVRLHPSALRSRRLIDIPFGEVAAVTATPADGEPFRIERSGGRWKLLRGGRVERADDVRADQLAAGIAGMRGEPTGEARPAGEPLVTWTVTAVDGRTASFVHHGRLERGGAAHVARADETELRRAPADLARFLDTRADWLEATLVTDFAESELAGIEIAGADREAPLVLDHWRRRFWYLRRQEGASPRVDPTRFAAFRDRILALRSLGATEIGEDFAPRWTLTFRFAGDTAPPPVVVEIEAPDERGRARARRSDAERGFVLDAASLEVLDTRSWELMQRAFAQGSDALISRLAIRDENGALWSARRSETEPETWIDESGERVPSEFLDALLARLAYLVADDVLGPLEGREALFETPRYVVTWSHPEPAPPEGGPGVPVEKVWTVGGRVDDVRRACTVNTFPGIVFTIAGKDLLPVEQALSGLRR